MNKKMIYAAWMLAVAGSITSAHTIDIKAAATIKITTAVKKITVGETSIFKARMTGTKKAKLVWSVSNKQIASINSKTGRLKAKAPGLITVKVRNLNGNGESASVKVKVTARSWKQIYADYLLHANLTISQDYQNKQNTSKTPSISFFDINGDGTPELFYYNGSELGASPWYPFEVYTIQDGKVKKLFEDNMCLQFEIFQKNNTRGYRVILQNGRGSWPYYAELTTKGLKKLFDLDPLLEDWSSMKAYQEEFKHDTFIECVNLERYNFLSNTTVKEKQAAIKKAEEAYKPVALN